MLESNNSVLIEFVWIGFSCVRLYKMSTVLKQLSDYSLDQLDRLGSSSMTEDTQEGWEETKYNTKPIFNFKKINK